MAQVPINTLYQRFRKGLKPLAQHFWDVFDSYWHKAEKIPSNVIDGLQELLDSKMDKKAAVASDQVGVYSPIKNYVYDALLAEYVSFANPNSANEQFQTEKFYRLKENAPAGQNPESHPAHWAYQGTTIGEITIDDVVGLREELDSLAENSGSGTVEVDSVATKDSAKAVSSGGVYKTIKQTFKVESTTDYGVIGFDEAFKITSVVAAPDLTVTIKKSDDTDYTLGDTVVAFDELRFYGDTLGKLFTIKGEIV